MKSKICLLSLILITLAQTISAAYDQYPIIFLHGLHGNEYPFIEMENELNMYTQKGTIKPGQTKAQICGDGIWQQSPVSIRATYYTDLTYNKNIDQLSQNLGQVIEIVKQCSGKNKVNLIGHSLGGLVARQYIKFHDGANNVNKLIILGSPNHGNIYVDANSFIPICLGESNQIDPVCFDLLKASKFYTSINSEDETPGDVKYYTIAGNIDGQGDGMVYYKDVELQGAKNIVVQDCDHGQLIFPSECPAAFEHIKVILQEPSEVTGATVKELQDYEISLVQILVLAIIILVFILLLVVIKKHR